MKAGIRAQVCARRGRLLLLALALVCLGLGLTTAEEQENESGTDRSATSKLERPSDREVYASWYDVPVSSLAKKRAGLEELTAAHNRLPPGTMVRVTHLANGKSVLVRITDRGITNRKIKLDLCKEAARELDMVGKGIARVRMQAVPEDEGAVPSDSEGAALP